MSQPATAFAPAKTIVVADADERTAHALQLNLELDGYLVDVCTDPALMLSTVHVRQPGLLLMDLVMPGHNGFEMLSRLRASNSELPIVVISAQSEEMTRVAAFRLGANDFVSKPFSLLELRERIRVHSRRGDKARCESLVNFGTIQCDIDKRELSRSGKPVSLTQKEWEVLATLIKANGRTVTRNEFLRSVWHYKGVAKTRCLDFQITSLRKKIEVDADTPQHIITIRNIGYQLQR